MGSSVTLDDIGAKIPHNDMQFHRTTIADLLGRQQLSFPGAQPVSFARKHFAELQRTDYFLCEKTDGIRCLLYLTSFVGQGEEEAQFLIDRKNEYYYIARESLHLPRDEVNPATFHTGTLLDGELVRQDCGNGRTRLVYLIFDALCMLGESITDRPFHVRLGKINALVMKPYKTFARKYPTDVEAQPFGLQLKKMETSYGSQMMFRDVLPNLPHGNDGLIFTCKTTPYVAGTDPHILKWKPPHENTIDFKLQIVGFPMDEDEDGVYEDWDAKPEIELLVNHGDREGGYQRFANLALTDAEWEAIKGMGEQIDHRIIECFRDPITGCWRPKIEKDGTPRYRDDKKDANHISTVKSVIESIEDAVTEEDLVANSKKIRDCWKEREAEERRRHEHEKRRAHEAEMNKRRMAEAARQRQQAMEQDDDDAPKYDE